MPIITMRTLLDIFIPVSEACQGHLHDRQGRQESGDNLKGFGYGTPLFLEYEVDGEKKGGARNDGALSYVMTLLGSRAVHSLGTFKLPINSPPCPLSDNGAFLASGELLSTGTRRSFFFSRSL